MSAVTSYCVQIDHSSTLVILNEFGGNNIGTKLAIYLLGPYDFTWEQFIIFHIYFFLRISEVLD